MCVGRGVVLLHWAGVCSMGGDHMITDWEQVVVVITSICFGVLVAYTLLNMLT